MELFGGVMPVKGITFLVFCLLGILFAGYALGRITIKGVSLGDAGVFIVALLFGAFLFKPLTNQLLLTPTVPADSAIVIEAEKDAENGNVIIMDDGESGTVYYEKDDNGKKVGGVEGEKVQVEFVEDALEIIEKIGLIFFVTAVGFIAGPKFFGNLKKNFKSYVLLGLVITLAGGLAAVACIFMGRAINPDQNTQELTAMIVGLLSGSLTSTPAFSAAKLTVAKEFVDSVSVGHGIAYIFGVLGVVLFVQLVPKFMKANMDEERAKLETVSTGDVKKEKKNLFKLDGHGFAAFSLAALLGILVGAVKVPLSADGLKGTCFSLTMTGGCLMIALLFGHFGRIGKISLMPDEHTLKLLREIGLVLFLAGAGIPGGAGFVEQFDIMYFVYGVIMTIVPMFIGFFFAKYVLKLSLLNNLGSLTGGMTSTPALGTLIGVSGTEAVASAYAATYPIALIAIVLVSQFLVILF